MASYQVEVTRQVRKEIRRLPGNMRQRVIRMLQALKQEPRPHNNRPLNVAKAGIELEPDAELRRIGHGFPLGSAVTTPPTSPVGGFTFPRCPAPGRYRRGSALPAFRGRGRPVRLADER